MKLLRVEECIRPVAQVRETIDGVPYDTLESRLLVFGGYEGIYARLIEYAFKTYLLLGVFFVPKFVHDDARRESVVGNLLSIPT
jgi:hypothetical protein